MQELLALRPDVAPARFMYAFLLKAALASRRDRSCQVGHKRHAPSRIYGPHLTDAADSLTCRHGWYVTVTKLSCITSAMQRVEADRLA